MTVKTYQDLHGDFFSFSPCSDKVYTHSVRDKNGELFALTDGETIEYVYPHKEERKVTTMKILNAFSQVVREG